MKKLIVSIIMSLLTLFLCSCGVFTQGNLGANGGDNGLGEDQFTVTLEYDGARLPTVDLPVDNLEVQITDGYSYYQSKVGEDGVARFKEVEGSFKVVLTGLPEEYTYNPNVYTVSNEMPKIILDVYKVLKPVSGNGKGLREDQGCYVINKAGIYRAKITSSATKVYYEFRPTQAGEYGIESIVPTAVNKINPKANVHIGSFAYKPEQPSYVLDTGGQCSTYTKNFKYDVKLTKDMIGNVYTFVISATEKNGQYPFYVDFALVRVGDFTLDTQNSIMKIPEDVPVRASDPAYADFIAKHHTGVIGKTWKHPEVEENGLKVFSEKYYYYSETTGYWHRDLDMDKAVGDDDINGTDPIVYAKISQASRFLDPLTTIEDAGNKALTIDGYNYKLFIEGYNSLVSKGYYCVYQPTYNVWCPCHVDLNGKPIAGSCFEGCATCNPECRPCPPEQKGVLGYAGLANRDGACPVTDELQQFLLKFSRQQRLYNDGNGWAETGATSIDSTHDAQWLFACGYYM